MDEAQAPVISLPDATTVVSPRPASPYDEPIRRAIEALDVQTIAAQFRAQDEFVYIERFLPLELVTEMAAEAHRLQTKQHRTWVPRVRKGGSVGQETITREAPALAALHWSPAAVGLVSRLAGVPLSWKHPGDAHAAALYYYQRKGDHVGWHYDACGCDPSVSYTATLALVNQTQVCKAHYRLFAEDASRAPEDVVLSTVPGSLVIFCGSKAYHRVTPLGVDEERIAYSFTYAREGRRLRGGKRFYENVKDAILYFGPRAIFQKNYD